MSRLLQLSADDAIKVFEADEPARPDSGGTYTDRDCEGLNDFIRQYDRGYAGAGAVTQTQAL